MSVVSDTGPLNYLNLIGAIEILPRLYGAITIPGAVRQELVHPDTPEIVREWTRQLPTWVSVRQPHSPLPPALGPGESEAIALAQDMSATLVLMDDRKARRKAEARGLVVTGTLGILANAAESGLLNFAGMISRLEQTNFHGPEELIASLLERFSSQS